MDLSIGILSRNERIVVVDDLVVADLLQGLSVWLDEQHPVSDNAILARCRASLTALAPNETLEWYMEVALWYGRFFDAMSETAYAAVWRLLYRLRFGQEWT